MFDAVASGSNVTTRMQHTSAMPDVQNATEPATWQYQTASRVEAFSTVWAYVKRNCSSLMNQLAIGST
jgi:hypothetical protein